MGELRELIGIYGAIDRAAAADKDRRDAVARLLPLYRTRRVRWYDDFLEWTDEKRESHEVAAFGSLEDSLRALDGAPAKGRMRARRLFAIAVAQRARPELLDPGNELWELAWRALRAEGLAGDDPQARDMLAILGDDSPFEGQTPGDADVFWDRTVERCAPIIIASADDLGPRPCSGRLVMVDLRGGAVPVATLKTVWETPLIGFDRATAFLEPSNWPLCCPFWCSMQRVGQVGDVYHYHEIVSTDCPNKANAWTLEADLDFTFRKEPGVAMTDYRLTKGIPQPEVLVDDGSLMVEQLGADDASGVRVTTTKRIRFARSFTGEALAMTMCALGYASAVEDLVFTCAALSDKRSRRRFPANAPAKAGPPPGSMVKAIATEAAAAVKECVDDCSDAVEASSKAISEGKYNADALVQDMAGAWVRLLREGATAVELGVRSARTAARDPGGGRAPDPAPKPPS